MLSYIDMKNHVEQMTEELAEGQTYHTNHLDCPAGSDRKRRFYITRKHGDFLCYCQHCGNGGVFSGSKERRYPATKEESVVNRTATAHFEWSNGSALEHWSDTQKMWWYSHEMDEYDSVQLDVRAFGPRLYVFSSTNLYIARNFGGGPKYVRSQTNSSGYVGLLRDTGPIYIVEDVLSCYKLYKAGWNAFALLGTKMSSDAKSDLAPFQEEGREVVLWLDNDVAGKKGAHKLYKELSPMGLVSVVTDTLEPKQTPLSVLRDETSMEILRRSKV